ncbi:MAG: UDP-N-acetylglucosamine--N-acetylmuramyl-(pentapeptide) pyrophosphoryl-undecaprenol N-acetylglucosamine transferase [Phycisphaerales bacterium]|nr:UDP-N-acetylglucosamine--N-acetylmuramyl-(pentapeptide) pyrophosphoryl-undecaprenol N-acetylglucosamine transferase [Phycisphaerales bacterium]
MPSSPPSRVFIFAGGGTGGHLFPGLAITEQLRAIDPSIRAIFACSPRPLDAEILKTAGAAFEPIRAAPFSARPRGLVRFLGSWGGAVRQGRAIIRQARAAGATVHVVAMGGFVAAPVVQAARAERCPVTLVNLDAVPGLANRWIARHARATFTAAEVQGRPSWQRIAPIVRSAARPPGGLEHCRRLLNLHPLRPTLLITGGSQGAKSINQLLMELVRIDPGAFTEHQWQILHQAGQSQIEELRAVYSAAGITAQVEAFFDPMGPYWGAADFAVARSGAGNVAEAWASATPCVFLPYPYHKDEHQRRNAERLESAGCCILSRDLIEPAANAAGPGREIIALLRDPARRGAMRSAFRKLGPANGAEIVAGRLIGL